MKGFAAVLLLALATVATAQDATPLQGLQKCIQANKAGIPYVNGWGVGLSTAATTGRKMLQTAENCAAAAAISSAIPCTPQTVPATGTPATPSTPTTGTPPTAANGAPTGTSSSSPCGSTSNPVPWTGLLCSNGQVTDVIMSQLGPNIFKTAGCDVSTLSDLSGLPAVQRVDFTASGLNGTVPASWAYGAWNQSLQSLTLAQNPLITGPLPNLQNLTSLVSIDISSSGFTGSIPLSAQGFPALRSFVAVSNNLSGPLPASLPANLTTLNVGANKLNGTLPAYTSSSLGYIQVANNSISGCLPSQWATGLTNVTNIDVSNNQLSGPVPSTWTASGAFPTLQQINIVGNQLCGDLGQLGTPVRPVGQNNPNASRLVPNPGTLQACSGNTCA